MNIPQEAQRPEKPEGIFSNGDLWFGGRYEEEGRHWYYATDKAGNVYETEEV